MTDPVIPPEAVEAAARSLYQSDAQGQWEHGELDLLLAYHDAARAAVAAALPHLRPPICGDVACPGLANCEDPDCLPARCAPLLKAATQVGLKLGRQEMLREVLDRLTADGGVNLGAVQRALRGQGEAPTEKVESLERALGRQEALAEIAAEMALSHPEDPRVHYVEVQIDLDTYRQIMAARDTGKGDSA